MGFIIEALDGRVFDGAIHAFDLTIGPGMLGFGQAMIDVSKRAGIFEDMRPETLARRRECQLFCVRCSCEH